MPKVTRRSSRTRPATRRADSGRFAPSGERSDNTITVDNNTLTETIVAAVRAALQSNNDSGSNNDDNNNSSNNNSNNDSLVNRVVEDDTNALLDGGSNRNPPNESGPMFSSVTVPLGSRLSSRIKGKIWEGEFVDFGSLLDPSLVPDKYSISVTTPKGESMATPKLTLEPTTAAKKITNIDQWLSAFHTFVAVYCVKHQKEIQNLMKYGETVRDVAVRGGDWLYYDEQFRFLRQTSPELYPWDIVHWELWHRAVTFRFKSGNFRNDKQAPRSKGKPTMPKGTCWAFNSGKYCGGCKFEHKCHKCAGGHSGATCNVPPTAVRDKISPTGSKQPANNTR